MAERLQVPGAANYWEKAAMATVGLNFGSATSGTGFDVASTVTSILAIESAVETPWKAQIASLQAQDAALSGLGTNLSSLSTAVNSLTTFDGVLASKLGSSSNTAVLTLSSASSSAVAGSHSLVVNSLASTSSQYSDNVRNSADLLTGSLTVQIGSSAAQTLTLDSGGNTLSDLAVKINGGAYGVTASVITDTQGSRLSVVSQTSGAAGEVTLNSALTDTATGSSVGFSIGQHGADAQLTVDGLSTTSSSNTVTGAIPGVTFQLLSAVPGAQVQVQITNNNGAVESSVQSLVSAYNATVASIKTQEGKDSNGKAEPLFGDPTLALLQNGLAASLFGGAGTGTATGISSITQLGLSLGVDGTLTLDLNALGSALNSKFASVTGFFQNSGSFGLNLSSALESLGSVSSKGAISLALQQNSSQEAGLTQNIGTEETRVAADKTRLTAELNLANQILQSIPDQVSQIDKIYSAVTGYNTK